MFGHDASYSRYSSLTRKSSLLLAILDCLLLPLAAVSIGIGAWLVEKPNKEFELMHIVSDTDFASSDAVVSLEELNRHARSKGQLECAGYCLVAAGAFAITTAVLGLHGAKYKRMGELLASTVLTLLLSGSHLSAGILSSRYAARVEASSAAGRWQLQQKYFVPLMLATGIDTRVAASVLVNLVQVKGSCCGLTSHLDLADSSSWKEAVKQNPATAHLNLPISCCPLMKNFTDGLSENSNWVESWRFLQRPDCPVTKEGAHEKSCWQYIQEESQLQNRVLAAQILGFGGFALCLAASAVSVFLALQSLKYSLG